MKRFTSILAVVLTPLLWPAGVVLLWLSPGWSTRSKAAGTLIVPGGLALAVFLELGDRSSCPIGSTSGCVIGPTYALLHPFSAGVNHVLGALEFTTIAVLALAVAVHLAFALRRRWSEI